MPSSNPVFFRAVPHVSAVALPLPYSPTTTFPASLTPSLPSPTLPNLLSAITELVSSGQIRKLLNQHGAIYFQNLNLVTHDQFSRFARAFGFVPHAEAGTFAPIHVLAMNAATANEESRTNAVYAHHEFGSNYHHPAYVFLYCASAPRAGGETAINSSIVLYHQLKQRHPEFIQQLERRGVKYLFTYRNSPRTQPISHTNPILQAFGQHVHDQDGTESIRVKVEREIRRQPTATWEWVNKSAENPLGDLRCWHVLPAIRPHPRTGQPAFFNNIVSHFLHALDSGTLDPPHIDKDGWYRPSAFYGDGGLIPRQYLDSAVTIIRETRALVQWNKGDVLLLDNHAVQHGTEPWTGERRLSMSLWDLEDG